MIAKKNYIFRPNTGHKPPVYISIANEFKPSSIFTAKKTVPQVIRDLKKLKKQLPTFINQNGGGGRYFCLIEIERSSDKSA